MNVRVRHLVKFVSHKKGFDQVTWEWAAQHGRVRHLVKFVSHKKCCLSKFGNGRHDMEE
jgi:hypothetical protein